jgi:hypothetical protein
VRKLLAGIILLGLATLLTSSGAQQTDTQELQLTVTPQGVVELAWDASPTPTVIGYNAYRGGQDGGPYGRLNAAVIPGLTYDDDTVERGKTYYYVVRAVNPDSRESVNSNQATAVIPQEPGS